MTESSLASAGHNIAQFFVLIVQLPESLAGQYRTNGTQSYPLDMVPSARRNYPRGFEMGPYKKKHVGTVVLTIQEEICYRNFTGWPKKQILLSESPASRPCKNLKSRQLGLYNMCKSYVYIWVFPKIMVTPKSSILIGFSIINHPFWGTPIFGNIHMYS